MQKAAQKSEVISSSLEYQQSESVSSDIHLTEKVARDEFGNSIVYQDVSLERHKDEKKESSSRRKSPVQSENNSLKGSIGSNNDQYEID